MLPEVGYEVGRIELATDFDDPVCLGTLRDLDEHVAFVEAALDRPRSDAPLRIYWIDGDVDAWCGDGHGGCFFPGTAVMIAHEGSITHEIVHAVLATPDADRFVEEGLAEFLGGGAVAYDPRASRHDLSAALTSGVAPRDGDDYVAAHHFIAWLVERGGSAMLPTLADIAERGAEGRTLELRLAGALSRPYDALLTEYRASARPFFAGTREAAIPRIELADLRGLATTLDCEAEDTRGPRDDGATYRVFALAVEADVEVVLALEGDRGVHVSLFDPDAGASRGLTTQWRIPDASVDPDAIELHVGATRRVELEAGHTYLVVFVGDASRADAVLRCEGCPKKSSAP
ncbi:MAG TPA: hypothetical protein VG755_26330 [Nannocystaceae bacterium]|nr:hypothetical protein [Nannocystaceae bacterium]